ncbi:hypothetical protein OKW96_05185 [Sphingobacterium sp. KU25419]|jgi:hypothetical protein|nr:hypothetical protein OKW96_05185 [Sphingobacterium sp. KU25419]
MRKEFMNKNNDSSKKLYQAPNMKVIVVEMEQGIAASSANVAPGDGNSGTVKHEWEVGSDASKEFSW